MIKYSGDGTGQGYPAIVDANIVAKVQQVHAQSEQRAAGLRSLRGDTSRAVLKALAETDQWQFAGITGVPATGFRLV